MNSLSFSSADRVCNKAYLPKVFTLTVSFSLMYTNQENKQHLAILYHLDYYNIKVDIVVANTI